MRPSILHGSIHTMLVTIDAAGRIVVPKALRDELKLAGGTTLEIRAHEGKLELEPVATPMRLVRRGKGLVATTDEPLPTLDVDDVRSVTESFRR
jgi:AbrB family looped-hinge helix DNA binding protein